MLHSALPRAFLPPPGLCYLGGYYGEAVHPYSPLTRFVTLENAYTSIHDPHHHHQQQSQQSIITAESMRPITPSPLDLSLKPPPELLQPPPASESPDKLDECEAIEVDDIDEGRDDERYVPEQNYRHQHHNNWDTQFNVDDQNQRSPIAQSFNSYEDLHNEIQKNGESTNLYQSETLSNYHSPSSSPVSNQKIVLTSPNSLRSMQTYQQQLLLTPQHHLQGIHAPMTPPSTPSPPQCPRRRNRDDEDTTNNSVNITPINTTPKTPLITEKSNRLKKKHVRRLKFDEDTSSPVSGTVILGPDEAVVTGDIDPAFNIVEVTEEARAELAKIENRLGPYQCKLCRQLHDDAFQLAQHRCSRIAHVEYRCPECDKRFSCPANLASHRRWHKPRMIASDATTSSNVSTSASTGSVSSSANVDISCTRCDAKFTRQAALRKHLATQHSETNNNISIINNNHCTNSNSSSNSNNNICIENENVNIISTKSIINSMAIGNEPHSIEMP